MSEIIHLAHLPCEVVLYISSYTEVENAAFLKEQLIAGNQDFNFSFIDASSVISRKHVLAACFRALNDFLNERLKSNNVHSEIVFCLSPNNNIGDAFRRFGVQDTTTNLIVIKVATDPEYSKEKLDNYLQSVIHGKSAPFDNEYLQSISDSAKIRKTYKLGSQQLKHKDANSTASGTESPERSDWERQILGLMALRGAT